MIDQIQNIKARFELFARFQAAVLDARSRPFSCAYATGGDAALLEENKRLKKENARLQEEAEILKKAAKYFAQLQ